MRSSDPVSERNEPIATSEPSRDTETVCVLVSAAVQSAVPVTASTVANASGDPVAAEYDCQSDNVVHTTGVWLYQESPPTAATV